MRDMSSEDLQLLLSKVALVGFGCMMKSRGLSAGEVSRLGFGHAILGLLF
jgi:hypothetical protein